MLAVGKANKKAVSFIDSTGCNCSVFYCSAPKVKSNQIAVTSRGSCVRQNLLASATSVGSRLIATGGAQLNSSGMLISHDITVKIDRKKVVLHKKKKLESDKKIAYDALAAIAKFKDTKKNYAMDISD